MSTSKSNFWSSPLTKSRITSEDVKMPEMLLGYFRELCAVNEIDFLSFGQTGVKVDMASARAKTPKKLMEQIKLKVDGVAQEVVDAADGAIEIPQAGTKHSVNVSVAGGVVLWNFFWQVRPKR